MKFVEADDYRRIPADQWPWPSFSPQEIACRGTGKIKVSVEAMGRLQALRALLNAPLVINSAYRSPEHNRKVGGARNSQHLQGHAFDVSMQNHDPVTFEAAARKCGFTGFGFYPPKKGNFIHLDCGPPREWGTRWKAPKFDPEPKAKFISAPKAAATAAPITVAAAFEAVKPENLAQIQATVQPWVTLAPIFQTIFVVCGIGTVAWTIWSKLRKAP